jgi:hypothetical protein
MPGWLLVFYDGWALGIWYGNTVHGIGSMDWNEGREQRGDREVMILMDGNGLVDALER